MAISKIGTTWVVGLSVAASVIAAAAANSLITQGDVVFDTTNNTTPAIVVGTTDVIKLATTGIELPGAMSGSSLHVTGSGATTDLQTHKATGRVAIGLTTDEQPDSKFEIRGTGSGSTFVAGGGLTVIDGNFETQGTASGSRLEVNKIGAGSGVIRVSGPDGGGDCFLDSDAAGWTQCSYLNGVQTCFTVASC